MIAKEALKRASTIYLTEDTEYMFPNQLIENNLSLLIGQKRIVLSLKIELEDNYNINNYSFHKAIIKPRYALSYEDADEILDYQPKEEAELVAIERITNSHYRKRHKNGAITISEPEGVISKINSMYILSHRSRTSARNLISESMIIYGNYVAKYCIDRHIPVPYRNQGIADHSKLKDISNNCHLHVRNFLLRNALPKTSIDIKSTGHNSLGLLGYVQATSPLRRYIDYLSQCQIIRSLNKETILDVEFIRSQISTYDKKQKQNITLYRSDKRRSLLNWIKENEQKYWNVIFMQWLNNKNSIALVYFYDLSLDLTCKLVSSNKLQLGSRLRLSIEAINPELDILNTRLYC